MKLGCYKLHDDVITPNFATGKSACFDIFSYMANHEVITAYSVQNQKIEIPCCSSENREEDSKYIEISHGMRVLIPTGIIFNIPDGYSVRIHPRSGMSLKEGIILANCEGIIDQDYTDPTYIMLHNISMERVKIYHKQRIAQGELVKRVDFETERCYHKPFIEGSTRIGGFGSTGLT